MLKKFNRVLLGIFLGATMVNNSLSSSETDTFNGGKQLLQKIDALDENKPFLSYTDIYQCVETIEKHKTTLENPTEIIKQRIEATKNYFMTSATAPDLTEFAPGEQEWRNAKLVGALTMIRKCFGGIDIPLLCLEEIAKICSLPETDISKVKDRNFKYARYLIMSQCVRYDEDKNIFDLTSRHSMDMLSDAISMLQSATNGDKTKSDALIDHLRQSGKFRGFLG